MFFGLNFVECLFFNFFVLKVPEISLNLSYFYLGFEKLYLNSIQVDGLTYSFKMSKKFD